MASIDTPDNPFQLLRQRRFLPFFLTQFLGAFNDNVFKNALIILIAFQGAQSVGVDSNLLTNLSAALFILPFFLFSATAGQWIEKNEKSLSIKRIKQLEVVIMMCAAYAFYTHNIYLLIALLFFMGSQSTLFGPAKYSYIPQHLNNEELVGGNALVQMGTFIAILVGTMLGGILISYKNGSEFVAVTIVGLAIAGFVSSRLIPKTPSPNPSLKINWNPLTETWRNITFIYGNRTVFLSVLGISWFWFLGASYLVQLPNYTRLTLGGNEQVVTLLLTLFTLGIGAGSILCNWLSARRVELGLVPLGSIGLTVFGIDLFFAQPEVISKELTGAAFFLQQSESYRIILDILLIGVFGGLYIVPLFSLVQQRSDPAHLSRVIAGNNIINALLMVLSAVTAMVLLGNDVSIPQLFMVIAVLNAAVGLYIFTVVPEFFMRFLVWVLIHSIYHVRKRGLDCIPDEGAAVLVCNHVSYVDALIIMGSVRRPIRFVMYYKIFDIPVLRFIFKTAGAIPIAGKYEDVDILEQAFSDVENALNAGELVCVFPEGKLSHDGHLNVFKPGIERIIQTTPVKVVPVALQGLWGSFFSRKDDFVLKRLYRGIRSSVRFVAGEPVEPKNVSADVLQKRVKALLEIK